MWNAPDSQELLVGVELDTALDFVPPEDFYQFAQAVQRVFLDARVGVAPLLKLATQYLSLAVGARACLLYVEEANTLSSCVRDEAGGVTGEFSSELVLAAASGDVATMPAVIDASDDPFTSAMDENPGVRVRLHTNWGGRYPLPQVDKHEWLVIDSPRSVLCRGVFCLLVHESRRIYTRRLAPRATYLVDAMVPFLEVAYRRHLNEGSAKLYACISASGARDPRARMASIQATCAELLGVAGASLFVNRPGQGPATIELVSTHPKPLPTTPPKYESAMSPTMLAVAAKRDCIIGDVSSVRHQLRALYPNMTTLEPVWPDLPDSSQPRSIIYCFYRMSHDDQCYVLRGTNAIHNPSHRLTAVDRLLARELMPALTLLHRTLESEYEALNNYLNVTHDIKQQLEGITLLGDAILGAAPRVREAATREDLRYKARHLQMLARRSARLLKRFRLSVSVQDAEPRRAIKPYAEVVRPIVESYKAAAERRKLRWAFHGQDQLGLLYLSGDELQEALENLVRNAIKYTYEGESVVIAFERIPRGGGLIHVASRSLPIEDDEVTEIFKYRYRGRHARRLGVAGDGLGLGIGQDLLKGLGGELRFRRDGEVNVFTAVLPSRVFRP